MVPECSEAHRGVSIMCLLGGALRSQAFRGPRDKKSACFLEEMRIEL